MKLGDVCSSIESLLQARPATHNERVYWTGWLLALLELGRMHLRIALEQPAREPAVDRFDLLQAVVKAATAEVVRDELMG